MLVFVNQNKENIPFGFYSKSLTATESKLPPIKGEALALKWVLKKVRKEIMFFEKVRIVTDHQPLVYLLKYDLLKKKVSTSLKNKLLLIIKYNIPVQYKSGVNNMADSLSRLVLKNREE